MTILTDQQVQDLYVEIGTELQAVVRRRFGAGLTDQQAAATVSALGSVAAIFIAQDEESHRKLLNIIIDQTVANVRASAEFQEGMRRLRAGETPPENPHVEQVPVAASMRAAAPHGADNCLCCAISALISERYGEKLEPQKLDDVLLGLAGAVTVIAQQAGMEIMLPFIHHLNVLMANMSEAHDIEGMTKQ
ncbi:hypothetical protein [Bosea massiliensis]|uniref:Uncharacterized protein n=1 Tax=Bosea massiliensis TaxID=151419 RepID=A0ABW0PAA5_9HYPH